MIKHMSFKHGWFYHYRVHVPKLEHLCSNGLGSLKDYLEGVFNECPQEPFDSGPRSSSLRFDISAEPVKIEGHEVSSLASLGVDSNRYKTAHSNVQMLMLEEDDKTVGVEVPIWLDSSELEDYKKIFDSDDSLSGHIDALRIEDGKIWVWDYKPKASKEKFASTQIFFYALMLSKRTGIGLENFRCGYFDEEVAYVFKPSLDQLKVSS